MLAKVGGYVTAPFGRQYPSMSSNTILQMQITCTIDISFPSLYFQTRRLVLLLLLGWVGQDTLLL